MTIRDHFSCRMPVRKSLYHASVRQLLPPSLRFHYIYLSLSSLAFPPHQSTGVVVVNEHCICAYKLMNYICVVKETNVAKGK